MENMMRYKRIDDIIKYIYQNKSVTLDQICDNFSISKSTIRRDLNEILKDTNIRKTYGGLTLNNVNDHNTKYLTSFSERNIENIEELHSISLKPYELNHLEHFLMFWRFYIS